jgi:hypothetical protein
MTDVCVIGFVVFFYIHFYRSEMWFLMFLTIISELFQRQLVVIRTVAVVGLQVTRPIRCYFRFSRPAFRIFNCGQLHFFISHCEARGGGYLQGRCKTLHFHHKVHLYFGLTASVFFT